MNNNLSLFNQNNCHNDDKPHFQPIYFVVASPTGATGGTTGPTHTLISESKI